MMELLEQSPFDLATERRVVIIADWLPPDFGAVGQYMQMRAEHLAERGHEVTLVGLATLLQDRDASRAMGERGRTLVIAEYGWDAVAARMTEVYRAAIQGQDRRAR